MSQQPDMKFVTIAQCVALAQQVPAAVEVDLDGAEPTVVGFEGRWPAICVFIGTGLWCPRRRFPGRWSRKQGLRTCTA